MTATAERTIRLPCRHPAQAQIVAEALRFNVVQCGRRFGKTTLGVDLDIDVAIEGLPVGWFAPTYKLLDEAWRDFRRATVDAIVSVDRQQRRIELMGGGVIEFWSLDHPDAGRGRKYARIVVDEAGIVRDLETIWTQAIRPTLTDLKGDAWFLGTPKGRNYFHRLFLRGQQGDAGWKSWRFATVANPYLDPAEIEDARGGLPDLAFRQEYLGEAIEDGGNPFGSAAIAECVVPSLSTALPVCYGLDLAKSTDWTVLIGLDQTGTVCRFERWQGPWELTIAKVVSQTGNVRTLVDSTGAGDPVLESLRKRGKDDKEGSHFFGFTFSQSSKQQLMEELAIAIHQKTVRFPDGVIRNELDAFEYEYSRTGVKYSAPAGLHDDAVIALALAKHIHNRVRPLDPAAFKPARAHA